MSNVTKQLKRGTLDLTILHLLGDGPMYGYQLVSTIEKLGGEGLSVKEGTLYPVLYRLEDKGLVVTEWNKPERGVPRKYYHITQVGSARLTELVQEWKRFSTAINRILEYQGDSHEKN